MALEITPILNMRPIVAVIGTTGVGKSQLAVHLALSLQSYNGVGSSVTSNAHHSPSPAYTRGTVLSADSMQLYKGLDLITNKITRAEMAGIEHWGLDVVQPGQGNSWELGKWCSEADKVINTLPIDTLPIVCGGTHYFIQHFLFPPPELSVSRPPSPNGHVEVNSRAARWTPPCSHPPVTTLSQALSRLLETFWTGQPVWPEGIATSSSDVTATRTDAQLLCLHQLLSAVDPQEAGRWHWRDGRKVQRGLERWWERGQSERKDMGHNACRRARFRTLIFWVYEPLSALRPRLDKRVDKMVENGLLREIAELRGIAEKIYGTSQAADYTEGIFQAIGFKEFADLSTDAHLDPSADPAFPVMLERMKLSTHQYAKAQIKWITKQLLPAVREALTSEDEVHVYAVPGGEANEAFTRQILIDFLACRPLPDSQSVGHPESRALLEQLKDVDHRALDIVTRQRLHIRRDCSLCSTSSSPYSVMLKDWDEHVKSKSHKRNVVAANGGRDALIERQKQAGLEKAAERARLRELKIAHSVE